MLPSRWPKTQKRMLKLVIIADDFTGALDNAVQFAEQGVRTQAAFAEDVEFTALPPQLEVLAVTTESRHLLPQQAYRRVRNFTERAWKAGVLRIYKKTDSALRGNIGAELQAVLDGTGMRRLTFLPAYPEMGRITRCGIHYCGGVPVSESTLGRDPFDPVRTSDVCALVRSQTALPVRNVEGDADAHGEGILIYSAEENAQIRQTARALLTRPVFAAAGSAGLSAALAAEMGCKEVLPARCPASERILFVCGSVHPTAMCQIRALEKELPAVRLPQDTEALLRPETCEWASETLQRSLEREPAVILSVSEPEENELDIQSGKAVSGMIAEIVSRLAEWKRLTLVVVGGDTLMAVCGRLFGRRLEPCRQILPGVVLSKTRTEDGTEGWLISKAGSFGEEKTLLELLLLLQDRK